MEQIKLVCQAIGFKSSARESTGESNDEIRMTNETNDEGMKRMPKHEFRIVREYENNEAAIKEDEGTPERLFVIRAS